MPVVVVDQPKLFIVVFAAPLDGLGDVPFGGGFSVRRVGVNYAQVTGFPEDFRDVPGQIPPIGVPGAVFADGRRARSLGLRRVPEQEPSEDPADGILQKNNTPASKLAGVLLNIRYILFHFNIRYSQLFIPTYFN